MHGDLLCRATCSVQQPYHRCGVASHTDGEHAGMSHTPCVVFAPTRQSPVLGQCFHSRAAPYEGPDGTPGRRPEYDSPLASVVGWLTSGAFRPAR